ncbi:MAG: hemerythrin domain-containing protein [Mariprofundaceae bacterium]
MSDLIQQLQKEHNVLAGALASLEKSRYSQEQTRAVLDKIKTLLLTHLQKEDLRLYPVLHAEAESNHVLERQLQYLAKDMEKITTKVFVFFDKYDRHEFKKLEFIMDLAELTSMLNRRLHVEETVLYTEYDRLMKRKVEQEDRKKGIIYRIKQVFS